MVSFLKVPVAKEDFLISDLHSPAVLQIFNTKCVATLAQIFLLHTWI